MGAAGSGRRALPIEHHLANGSYNATRMGEREPDKKPSFVPLVAACPTVLDGWGSEVWERVYPLVTASGLLSERERDVLTGFCIAVGRVNQSAEELCKDGIVQTLKVQRYNKAGEPSGIEEVTRVNLWYDINREALADMGKFASLLGLTAVDRGRVLKATVHDKPPIAPVRQKTALDAMGPLKFKPKPPAEAAGSTF